MDAAALVTFMMYQMEIGQGVVVSISIFGSKTIYYYTLL